MKITVRIPASLIDRARNDLCRPHPTAAERVGFFHARNAFSASEGWFLYPHRYVEVRDSHYVLDRSVGARISGDAIREQTQASLDRQISVLHVHVHEHHGTPVPSPTDRRSYPPLLKSLRNAAPKIPHGALILSQDSIVGLALCPNSESAFPIDKIVAIGRPIGIFNLPGETYA